MAASTQDLRFRVLAQVVGADAINRLNNNMDSLNRKGTATAGAFKLLGTYFGAQAIVSYTSSLIDMGGQMFDLSQKTGVSASKLQRFREQAEQADVPLESLTGGLRKLSVNLVAAAGGSDDMQATFKALGVNVKASDGSIKDAGVVIDELRKKFVLMKDGPEKAAIAVKLFGRSGSDLIPFLNDTSSAVSRLSTVIDDEFAARGDQLGDTFKAIKNNLDADAIENFKVLLPTLQDLANAFEGLSAEGSDFSVFLETFAEASRIAINGIVVSFNAGTTAIDLFVVGVLQMGDVLGLNFDVAAQRGAAAMDRAAKRLRDTATFVNRVSKNSLIFGQGTIEDIRARQAKETKPPTKPKGGTVPGADEIGSNGKVIKSFEEKLAKMRAETASYGESNASKERAILLADLESRGLNQNSAAYKRLAAEITVVTREREVAKEKQAARSFGEDQRDAIELQRLELSNVGMSTVEIKKLTEARALDNEARKATKQFTTEGAAAYKAEVESIKAEKLALIDLEQQQKETYSTGAKQALAEYLESARDVASQVKGLFQNAFGNMEESLVQFVKTGKLNFAKFADDLITDIIRIQVRAALVQGIIGVGSLIGGGAAAAGNSYAPTGGGSQGYGLGGSYQFAKGGVMTGYGEVPLRKYANGGVASSPQLAMFGEGSTPEAYVPLPDGRSIPVTMDGGSNGVVINVNVNTATGETDASAGPNQAQNFGRAIAEACKNVIRNEKRPGGMLA